MENSNSNLNMHLNELKHEANDIKIVLRKIILDYQKCDIKYDGMLDELLSWLLTKFTQSYETEIRILLMNAICVLLKSLLKQQNDVASLIVNTILLDELITDNFYFIACILNLFVNNKTAIQLYFIEGILKYDILDDQYFENQRFDLLMSIFEISEENCLSCEKISFVAFRCLHKLVLNFTKHKYWPKLDNTVISRILLIINSNWDNTVTGVRENNCKILNETLKNLDQTAVVKIFQDTLIHLSWLCKSKYFILLEILKTHSCDHVFEHFCVSNKNQENFVLNLESFCDGLLSSLSAGGVISAGTNLFIELWKSIQARNYLHEKILEKLKTEPVSVIQTLYNYWLPHIVKTTPEIILKFLEELKLSTDSKHWYPICCLLVLCRKNGLINEISKDEHILQLLNNCSANSNESLRSLYFQFLCITPKTFISPTAEEYNKVKIFLFCNASSDCTYLRQSIVNSFTLFIIRVRDSSLNNFKLLKKDDSNLEIRQNLLNMAEFLNWIHAFLTVNLNSEANYQRKYLSLMLYDVVLRYLNGGTENLENRRKGLCRKGNLKSQGMKVCEYLMKENQWKFTNDDSLELLLRSVLDPTNDVRELAVKIMVEYFIYSDFQDAKQIVLKSFGLCNSTTTHETECGALYMVLLLQLQKHDEILGLMNEVLNTKSRTIIECLTNLLEQQYVEFEQDCVKAILNHKPMYGILTALKFLINNCTLSEAILNTESMINLLQMTEKICQFCLNTFAITAPKTEYLVAPSFSEMDDAVTFLISNSKSAEEIDCSNIYQDVFNSLWMTLRLCTDISSALANTLINGCEYLSNSDINSNEVITRCSQIIVSALTRCRHKGVIEGAGLSLANFIRNLTKVHPESKLPEQILEKHIFSTLTSTYKGPSMTRRGAGMGILFHRLISSDNRDNKPLLKHAMTNLLMILKEVDTEPVLTVSQSIVDDKNLENIEGSEEMAEKSQSEVSDVIEASVLHYVKGLVQDSSLKVDLAPYMSELTGLAFKYFFAPSWPIRNGALQLFGAIVPKFIGQKKGVVGTLDDTAVEIPPSEGILHLKMNYLFIDVGELLLHYPELRQIIYTTLTTKIEDTCNVISNHACLVPVLSLLSGAVVGLTTSYDDSLKQTVLDFQVAFVKLFSSPIQVVRNLAAKCYACLTPLPKIQNQIIYLCKQLSLSNKENFTHGALLGLAYLVDKFLIQGKYMFDKSIDIEISNEILKLSDSFTSSTYYTKTLYLDIMCTISNFHIDKNWICSYEYLLSNVNVQSKLDFGIPIYIQNLTKHLVSNCDFKQIPLILDIVLENYCTDVFKTFFIYFFNRLETKCDDHQIIFDKIFNYLLDHMNIVDTDNIYLIFQVLLKVLNSLTTCCPSKLQKMYKAFIDSGNYSINIITLAINVVTSILNIIYDRNTTVDWVFIKDILKTTCTYAEYCTEDVRINVAKSLNNIVIILFKGSRNNQIDIFLEDKVKCVNTIINLLQDENADIRNEMTNFYSGHLKYIGGSINPTVCLLLFLNSNFLKILFADKNIYLERKLQELDLQNGIDAQNVETLQYLTNVFYENFFLKMIVSKSIKLSDNPIDLLSINDEYIKIL